MKLPNKIYQILPAIILFIFCISIKLNAQWVTDPNTNTRLVLDPSDPVNISALTDYTGGAYIFWEDKKGTSEKDIYFIHLDKEGKSTLRSDGKTVSTKIGIKEDPVAVVENSGNAIVMWKSRDKKNVKELFVQKLSQNGLRLWQNEGIQLTSNKIDKISHSLNLDQNGLTHISFITKNFGASNKYSVKYQTLTSNGKILNDTLKGNVYNTNSSLNETRIIPDNKGGRYVFWLENQKQKIQLRGQYIDFKGAKKWGERPLTISNVNQNVIAYSVGMLANSVFAAITYQGNVKVIYQRLISPEGKFLWGPEGKQLTDLKGSQINPQFVFLDSSVFVSWTHENEQVKSVHIQKMDINGNRLWGSDGKRIIEVQGTQFGQRISYDGRDAVIIAWIDNRDNSSYANLFIQKIDAVGKFLWDPEGILLASSKNMQKSYLNLIPDSEGGAIAVFKASLGKKNEIYGQKIFSTGTYASQIIGFDAEVVGDSVKIFWYAANEKSGVTYNIYNSASESLDENDWHLAGNLQKLNNSETNYYEFFDKPGLYGSVFYRVVQKVADIRTQVTPIKQVDYYSNVDEIVLGQNTPNPFRDSTTITFYLPEESAISIEFFNSNVETVKRLDNIDYPAGKNTLVFFSENLPAGIYFYRLKVNGWVDVKKMVIIDR